MVWFFPVIPWTALFTFESAELFYPFKADIYGSFFFTKKNKQQFPKFSRCEAKPKKISKNRLHGIEQEQCHHSPIFPGFFFNECEHFAGTSGVGLLRWIKIPLDRGFNLCI